MYNLPSTLLPKQLSTQLETSQCMAHLMSTALFTLVPPPLPHCNAMPVLHSFLITFSLFLYHHLKSCEIGLYASAGAGVIVQASSSLVLSSQSTIDGALILANDAAVYANSSAVTISNAVVNGANTTICASAGTIERASYLFIANHISPQLLSLKSKTASWCKHKAASHSRETWLSVALRPSTEL